MTPIMNHSECPAFMSNEQKFLLCSVLRAVSSDDLHSGKDKGTNLPLTFRFPFDLGYWCPPLMTEHVEYGARGISCVLLERPCEC